ncbi:MAG: hypothetical protein PHS30_06935 [Bacteroidales bacterium]|nr:hypothetical protein [Bacteroidales bacterium]
MNNKGEKINVQELTRVSRDLSVSELIKLLQANHNIFWSWGTSAYMVDNKRRPRWFRMHVNGHHFKGHVYISVNAMDLYEVHLTTLQGTIMDKTGDMGVYFDSLVEWIDDRVERIPAYKK